MKRTLCVLSVVLLTSSATCQEAERGSLFSRGRSASADSLLGAWVATGAEQERLEFHRGGALLVDGTEMRYRVQGSRLTIETDGESLHGTWAIAEPHLTITLAMPDGGSRSERYRREREQAPRRRQPEQDPSDAPWGVSPAGTRATAGRATFALPSGWGVANSDERSALLDLGLREPDTLDAIVIVTSDELTDDASRLAPTELLRSRLQAIAAELTDMQVEIDVSRASVREAGRAGAELRVPGTSAGEYPVSVWIGVVRNHTHFAAVLAVMVSGRESRFLPGARSVFESLQLSERALVRGDSTRGGDGGEGGGEGGGAESAGLAGLEFGHSMISGDSSLTILYAFGADGSVRKQRLYSSPFGGSESGGSGSYSVSGDSLTIQVDGEVVEATIERAGGGVSALRIGGNRYERS